MNNPLPPQLPEGEFWTPNDLAILLDISANAVTYHCRHLFPHRHPKDRYRLDRTDARRVLNYIHKVRLKKRSR